MPPASLPGLEGDGGLPTKAAIKGISEALSFGTELLSSWLYYKLAMIALHGTPLCRATARRIETNVPSRRGWWSGITIRW